MTEKSPIIVPMSFRRVAPEASGNKATTAHGKTIKAGRKDEKPTATNPTPGGPQVQEGFRLRIRRPR